MTQLSVIIPIYNTPVEELKRCFSSLSGLSGITWEAILIDDGSKEETGTFCQSFAEKDPRFRYFYKENGGVSSARNAGLDRATGTYVTFVDADDALIGSNITLTDAPLTLYDITLEENDWKALDSQPGPVTPWQLHHRLTVSKSLNSPCAKVFLRSVIEEHQLRFDPAYITAEDWSFVWDFCSHIDTALYAGVSCYRYFRDGGTGLGRLQKFPDTMIENQLMVFDKKEAQLPRLYPDRDTFPLLQKAAAIAVEDLFNGAADLKLMKLLTNDRKTKIRSFVCDLLKKYPGLPKKAALKAWVVAHCWPALTPLALARRQYLKK